ncbi:TPA: acyltransferase [Candidatus Gracilibacteria bacterium]|nr:acyltransferase [Candidatus Peregrinibacteria bacterium]HIQ56614.1 acyltransferase [Candidatus Gracilibacteria bacterium]HIQ57729.1 acyltransferase [Candidatus Gracilibacteria bacterium]
MKNFIIKIISKICIFYFTYRYFGKVTFGKNIRMNWKFKFSGKGKLIIKNNVCLWAHEEWNRFQTYSDEAVIEIGESSKLNGGLFQVRNKIVVGKNCIIGSAILLDNDFHYIDPKKRFSEYEEKGVEIIIGDNVWIAGQAVILKGVTIAKNSMVGMRAVVTRNVGGNRVVAGNPAKEVKKL